jgi:hypothetical protein
MPHKTLMRFYIISQLKISNCRFLITFSCTFVIMIKHFKIFLLTLISFCYGMTVFEFSDTEKKSNFENESHLYVQQHHDYSFENADLQTVPYFDITYDYPIRFCFDSTPIPSKDYLIYQKTFIQPPDRLFLLHSSFLI